MKNMWKNQYRQALQQMIPDLQIIDMQGTELPCSVPVYSLYVLNTANLQMVWEVSSD